MRKQSHLKNSKEEKKNKRRKTAAPCLLNGHYFSRKKDIIHITTNDDNFQCSRRWVLWLFIMLFIMQHTCCIPQFSSVQSLSRVRLFATPRTTARQASLSITSSQSSPKLMCIELVMPSSYLILCHPLLLLSLIPPSIRVFSNESTLRMR